MSFNVNDEYTRVDDNFELVTAGPDDESEKEEIEEEEIDEEEETE